jgi:hypothetical protein
MENTAKREARLCPILGCAAASLRIDIVHRIFDARPSAIRRTYHRSGASVRPPPGRRRSRGKDRSLGHLSLPFGVRRGAPRARFRHQDCLLDGRPHRKDGRSKPIFLSPHLSPGLLQPSVLSPGPVVETLVSLLQHGADRAAEGSPGRMIVDPGPCPGRPYEDLQRGASRDVVPPGHVPVFRALCQLQQGENVGNEEGRIPRHAGQGTGG